MTHEEAIAKLLLIHPTQMALAKALGVSQQSVSNIKRRGILPRKYWSLLGEVSTINTIQPVKSADHIDIESLTISQARALYEKLKEVFK